MYSFRRSFEASMGIGLDLSADNIPNLVVGVAMLALAVTMFVLNPRHHATRVLTLYLLVRGFYNASLVIVGTDASMERTIYYGHALFLAPIDLLVLYFATIYPVQRSFVPKRSLVMLVFIVVTIAIDATILLAPDTFATVSFGADGSALPIALGPLSIVSALEVGIYAGLVLAFARDYRSMQPSDFRRSLLLVTLGFGLDTLYRSIDYVIGDFRHLVPLGSVAGPSDPSLTGLVAVELGRAWQLIALTIIEFAWVPIALAVLVLLRDLKKETDPVARRDTRRAMILFSLPLIVAVLAHLASPNASVGYGSTIQNIAQSLWGISLPILVSYALLKHQLFDIDLKVKIGISKGAIGAVFLLIFFIVSQLIQNYANATFSVAGGAVAAGLCLFALTPIQKMAERLAEAAMPGVEDTPAYREQRKQDVYKSALRLALVDREVTRREERTLAELAEELGIGAGMAMRLREDVEKEIGHVAV